jgi:PAS domain S-box-containing protein
MGSVLERMMKIHEYGQDLEGELHRLRRRCEELEARLARTEARTRVLVEDCPVGIFYDDPGDKCIYVNQTFCSMMGLSSEQALGDGWADVVYPDDRERLLAERHRAVAADDDVFQCEYRFRRPDGGIGWVVEQTKSVRDGSGELLGYVGTVVDVTARHNRERAAVRARDMLQDRVRERSAEIRDQAVRLEEANAALKVLLRQREQDRLDMEKSILDNVRVLVMPGLERLRAMNCGPEAKMCIEVVREQVGDLVAPFVRTLRAVYDTLTPAEVQVADLIRQGRSTKEMAVVLGVSAATVETHRRNIRSKLGLTNSRRNLRTHLLSLG